MDGVRGNASDGSCTCCADVVVGGALRSPDGEGERVGRGGAGIVGREEVGEGVRVTAGDASSGVLATGAAGADTGFGSGEGLGASTKLDGGGRYDDGGWRLLAPASDVLYGISIRRLWCTALTPTDDEGDMVLLGIWAAEGALRGVGEGGRGAAAGGDGVALSLGSAFECELAVGRTDERDELPRRCRPPPWARLSNLERRDAMEWCSSWSSSSSSLRR